MTNYNQKMRDLVRRAGTQKIFLHPGLRFRLAYTYVQWVGENWLF